MLSHSRFAHLSSRFHCATPALAVLLLGHLSLACSLESESEPGEELGTLDADVGSSAAADRSPSPFGTPEQEGFALCHSDDDGVVRRMDLVGAAAHAHLGHGDWEPLTFFADQDGDGLGDAGSAILSCVEPEGFVANDLDTCDGVDSDEDGACDDVDVCPGRDDADAIDGECLDLDYCGTLAISAPSEPASGQDLQLTSLITNLASSSSRFEYSWSLSSFPDDELDVITRYSPALFVPAGSLAPTETYTAHVTATLDPDEGDAPCVLEASMTMYVPPTGVIAKIVGGGFVDESVPALLDGSTSVNVDAPDDSLTALEYLWSCSYADFNVDCVFPPEVDVTAPTIEIPPAYLVEGLNLHVYLEVAYAGFPDVTDTSFVDIIPVSGNTDLIP